MAVKLPETGNSGFESALTRAALHAPFLKAAMKRNPRLTEMLHSGAFDEALLAARAADGAGLRQVLRRRRDGLALVLAIGDLAGHLSLGQVVRQLSDFADFALDAAITEAIRARVPDADPHGFFAIALGKHGSRELNYSSDIDPILLFDPKSLPRRERDDAGEAAVRVARGVVDLLQTRDADGYVLRVDLRLRPASEATPLAIPVEAAISHYESSALGWERAAFIRGRAAAGDVAMGAQFLETIQPFIWRRSLDFGAIEELRAISRRIRAHHAGGQAFGPGFDLKRGRGGIREVEFFVQIHQLIHGGRDPSLRVSDTLGGIAALVDAGRIEPDVAHVLADAYRVFRTIEHRLQMVEDRQTHSLPSNLGALDSVARLHDLEDGDALLDLLAPHVDAVGRLYDSLDGPPRLATPRGGDMLVTALRASGLNDVDRVAARISEWRSGKLRAVRSDAAFAALEAVLPSLLEALGRAPDPDAALNAFDAMLGGLPSAINLFRLLEARPPLLQMLVEIISHAPTLAHALGSNAALLDRLLDTSAFDPVGDVDALTAEMTRGAVGLEAQLDQVRRIVGEHRFALGAQIVRATHDPLEVAAGYARVAEAAVHVIADATLAPFVEAHGRVAGSELVILALGRLGGGLLTHASDLDLVYLFTGDFSGESDGPRPLGGSHYYNRLGQRLSSGLSARTGAGALYEVDTRLRPSGGDGPLVASTESFALYQRKNSWTWEHMALTRARVVYGSVGARDAVSREIVEVLTRPRERKALARDVVSMRTDMAAHKPPVGSLDVKLARGGLVDLEFAVHFHQLASGVGLNPHLPTAIAGLIDAGIVDAGLADAHDLLTRLIVTLRLVAPQMRVPGNATQKVVARACRVDSWDDLLARVTAARQCVTVHWQAVVAEAKA